MRNTTGLHRGDRVEITGILPGDPCPLEIGDRGTVVIVLNRGSEYEQVAVEWKSGRKLMLLPGDPYRLVS